MPSLIYIYGQCVYLLLEVVLSEALVKISLTGMQSFPSSESTGTHTPKNSPVEIQIDDFNTSIYM